MSLILKEADNSLTLDMNEKHQFDLTFSFMGYIERFERYTGSIVFVPNTYVQELQTEDKVVEDNIKCMAVPYSEVSNRYGLTVNIGG